MEENGKEKRDKKKIGLQNCAVPLFSPSFLAHFSYQVCSEIQFPINSRASGEMVSSIFEYSVGDPV